jgi:anti-sigma regulatory factor (Ser/Thr protein kinase)
VTSALELHLPGGPTAASEARHALDDLRHRVGDDLLENVRLLVSELVTNSIRHSGAETQDAINVRIAVTRRSVRCEVCDPGPGFDPRVQPPTVGQTSGWGLFLVEQIADRWGVSGDGGTCVWFEISGEPRRRWFRRRQTADVLG